MKSCNWRLRNIRNLKLNDETLIRVGKELDDILRDYGKESDVLIWSKMSYFRNQINSNSNLWSMQFFGEDGFLSFTF